MKQQVKVANTTQYWRPGTEQAAWHDTSFDKSPVWIKEAIRQHDGELSGLARNDGGGAWYQRASQQIHMGKLQPDNYHAQGVWRHEYGHFLDHANGVGFRYRSSFDDFSALLQDETDAIVKASGYGRRSSARDSLLAERAQRYADIGSRVAALDKPGRKAYLTQLAEPLGLSLKDVETFLEKETAHVDDILARDLRAALALEAVAKKDAMGFMEAINGNLGYKERDANYNKGLVGKFSDLVGSASKNKILGHGPNGLGGHSNAYLKHAGAPQTEVFANLTALLGSDSAFWHKTVNAFYPELSKLFKRILTNGQ